MKFWCQKIRCHCWTEKNVIDTLLLLRSLVGQVVRLRNFRYTAKCMIYLIFLLNAAQFRLIVYCIWTVDLQMYSLRFFHFFKMRDINRLCMKLTSVSHHSFVRSFIWWMIPFLRVLKCIELEFFIRIRLTSADSQSLSFALYFVYLYQPEKWYTQGTHSIAFFNFNYHIFHHIFLKAKGKSYRIYEFI